MNVDSETILLIVLAVVVVLIPLAISLIHLSVTFGQELRYIKCEIKRSSGAEREHWVHEKRRLWLSLLPFYRR